MRQHRSNYVTKLSFKKLMSGLVCLHVCVNLRCAKGHNQSSPNLFANISMPRHDTSARESVMEVASIWTLLGGDLAVERALLALVLDATHAMQLTNRFLSVQHGFPMRRRAGQRAETKFARKLAMRVEDEVNHCCRLQRLSCVRSARPCGQRLPECGITQPSASLFF